MKVEDAIMRVLEGMSLSDELKAIVACKLIWDVRMSDEVKEVFETEFPPRVRAYLEE